VAVIVRPGFESRACRKKSRATCAAFLFALRCAGAVSPRNIFQVKVFGLLAKQRDRVSLAKFAEQRVNRGK
jgi:hypothetical protein